MTVDEHDMDARVQVRRTQSGNGWVDLCWRELPDLTSARRENWMADRAKNAMGTAKLASVYLDQERGRIGRLRKTKSVLASGKFIGKNLNKRRHRPHPTKPKHPQNQCHRRWREIYGYTLPNNALPSLPSRNLSYTVGNESASRSLTVSVARRSSRENLIDNGTPKSNYVPHGGSTTLPSASDVRDGANPSLALHTKGYQLRSNPPRISIKVDSRTHYVPGNLFDHDVQHRSKNSLSQPGPSPSSLEPSAIDLLDQCKILPELAIGLKEDEGRPQPPNCRDTNDRGSRDPDADKALATMDWPASTASAVRSLPLPDCASSDSRGTPCHEENSTYHEGRACNTTTQNRFSSTLEPPTVAEGSSPANSLLFQYQRSPERWKGAEEIIQRGESDTAEDGVLSPRRLNPVSVEAKIPASSEIAQHRGNTSPASPPVSLTTATVTQNDGGDEKGTSSQQRLVDALAELQKNKDLDALRSEYMEALSILQKITHPFSATSRTTVDEERQKVNDVAVQVTRVREKNRKKGELATETSDNDNDRQVDTYDAPDSESAPTSGMEVVPADERIEALSANLPPIDSREQNALRLLYRKWWTQIATGGSASCLPDPSNVSLDEGPTRQVSHNRRTGLVDEGGSKGRDAKMDTEAFVGEEIKRNCVQDVSISKQKDVAVVTEVENPGSIGDATTLFSSLRMWQPSKGKMGEERRISSAPETRRSSDVGRRPQVKNECTECAICVTPLSPHAVTSGITDDAGHTSHHHKSARAQSLDSAAGLTQNEKIRLSPTRTRQTNLGSPMAGEDCLEGPSNKPNQPSGDAKQGSEEEQTVSRCCQDITPVTRKGIAVIIKAKSLGSLEIMTRSPSESVGIQLASAGAGPEIRCGRARAVSSSPNIGCTTQGASEGATHDVHRTSCFRTKARDRDCNSTANFAQQHPPGCEGNQPGQILNYTSPYRKDGEEQVVARCSKDVRGRESPRSMGNQPSQACGNVRRGEEEQCFPRNSRSQDPTTVTTIRDLCVASEVHSPKSLGDDAGGPFVSFEEQLIPAGVGTDERRRSDVRARGSGLNVGGPRHVASNETEASTFETLIYLSPPIIPRGVPHNAHQTSRGRSGARTIGSSFVRDFALCEPCGYTGNQFNQNLSKSSRGEAEKQTVSRCFQDVILATTRKYVAVTTDTGSPGNLGTAGNNIKLNTAGPRAGEQRCSVVPFSAKSLDVGGVAIEDAEAVTAVILVSLSPPITTLDATHDVHQTNRGRARVTTINSSSAAGLMLHEPSGYTKSGPNQASINATRMNEEGQGEPRCSQDVTQAFTRKDVAVRTEIESPGNFGDVTSSTPVFLRVQLTSVGVKTAEEQSSGMELTWSSLDFGGSPQVARGDPEATASRPLVNLSPSTSAGYTIEKSNDASSSCTRSRASDSGSAVDIVEKKPSENPRNHRNQEPNDVDRGKEQEEEVPSRSRNVTSSLKLDNSTFAIEANSPGSLSDVSKSPSTFLGVQFISRGVGTDERPCISATSTASNSDVDGRQQIVRRDTEDAESVTLSYVSSHTSTRDDKGSEEDEYTVQRSSDDAAIVPKQNDDAGTTKTESVGSRRDKLGDSFALELQLPILGEGTDEMCRKKSMVQGSSLDVGGCPEVASKDAEAPVSVILVSPHASTRGTTDSPQNTTCGHTTTNTLVGLAVDHASCMPLGCSSNQPSQASYNASITKEEEEVALSFFQDITTALMRNYLGFVAKVESPGSLGDFTGSLSASLRVQLPSVGVNTDGNRCSSSAVATSLTMLAPPILIRGDTHDPHYTTYDGTKARHVNLGSAADLTADSHTSRGHRRRAKALSLDSAADVEQHEPLAYTGKEPNRALSGVQQWKGGEQAVQRCLQGVSTVPTRIDIATSTNENLGNIMRSPSASPRIQPTSAGQGVNKISRSEVSSKEIRLDVEVHPLSTCKNTEAMISSTPASPLTSTWDGMVDAIITSCGCLIASAISPDSAVSFARRKPSRYTDNPPNHASNDSRRGTEGKDVMPKCSKWVTAANKERDEAVGTEADSPESLGDVTGSSSAPPGVQMTSVAVNTNEHRRSGSAVAASLAILAPSIATRGDTHDAHDNIYDRTRARHVSLGSAVDLTPDSHTGRGRHRRARALSLDSAANVEQHEPLSYTGKEPSRALSDVQQWEGGKETVQRCPQDVSAAPTRIDVATSTTNENLGNIMRTPSVSSRIQPTSAGQGVDEISRREVSSKEAGLDVEVHPLGTCENIEAMISSTPVSPLTSTWDGMVDATIINCGCSIASAISPDSAVSFAQHMPLRYTDNPPNQTSNDSRRKTEGEDVVPKCSKEVTAANKQRDKAVGTEAESPESLGDVTGSSSASPGVQLTSRVEAGEMRRSGTGAETPITLASSSTTSRSATLDVHNTVADRMRARVVSLGSETDLTREDNTSHCRRTRAEALSLDSAACMTLDGYLEYTYKPNHTSVDARRWKEEEQTALRFYLGRTTAPPLKDIAVETEAKAPSDNLSDISGDSYLQLIPVKTWVDRKRGSGVSVAGDSSNICRSPQVESGDAEAATCKSLVYCSPPNIFSSATHEPGQTSHGRKRARAIDSDSPVDFVHHESLRHIGYQADQASSNSRWYDGVPAVPRCSHNAATATARKDVVVMTKAELPGSPEDIKLDLSASSGVQLASLGVGTNESHRSDFSSTGSSSDLDGRLQNTSEGIKATLSVIPVSQPVNTRITTAELEQTSLGRTSASAINFVPAADSVRQNPSRFTSVSSEHALNDATRGKEGGKAVPRCFQDNTTIINRRNITGATEAKSPGSLGGVMRDRSAFPGEQLTSVEVGTDERRRSGLCTTSSSSDVDNHPRDVSGGTQDATDDPDLTSGSCKKASAFNCDSIADLTEYEPLGYTYTQPIQTLRYASREKYMEHTMPRWPQSTNAATTREDIGATTETVYPGRFGGIAESKFVSRTIQLTLEGLETGQRRRGDAAVSTSSVIPVSPPIIAHGVIHDARSNISHGGARVTRGISPVGQRTHLATEGTGGVTSATLVHDSTVMNRGASQDGHYNSRDQKKGCAIIRDLRTGSEQDNPSRYRCNQLIQTSDARRGKDQGHMVSWVSKDITTVHQQSVITNETGEEPSGSLDDIENNVCASLSATLSSVGIETGETWRGDVRAFGRSSIAGRRSQGTGESIGLADSVPLQLPSTIIHDASYDAHHTSVSRARASARSHSCGARVAGRMSDSDRHPQGMIKGISTTLSPPPAIIYNATNDVYKTSCGFRETSARGRGLSASLGGEMYFERYTGNRPIPVLSDSRRGMKDTSTGTTQRDIDVMAQTEPPRDIGNVSAEGSPSLEVHLTLIEKGTDKIRPSTVMATERRLSVRRRPRVMIGDAEAETSMNLTCLSPPIITRDDTNDVHQNGHGRKRARDADFDPAVTPYKPSGYTESRSNNDFSNTRRSEEGQQGVRRYCQDVTTASTRKYVSIAGRTESPRKLGVATSVTPISSPTKTYKATIHAGYTNHSRPATKDHASGRTIGLGEGKPFEFSDDQTLSVASDKKTIKHGVAKVDVDEGYVSEDDYLETGEGEEGIYGRVYLPDGKFTTLLGLDSDRSYEDEDEITTEDGIISEISWQESTKWNHGEDAKPFECDDDDFE